jgi:4-hydroxy-tetrahydrodipicolinate synthase
LEEYLDHLVAELPLPLFLYNMPALTKVQYEMPVLRRAMDKPGVVGLKDSSGNMNYFRDAAALIKQRPDWCLLMGPEELLSDAIFAGGHGGVSGGANLFPRLYVELCKAARNGDLPRARQLQAQVMRVSSSLYRIGHHPSAIIKGIKCALACLGVCDDFMAEPFHRFRAREQDQVRERLAGLVAGVEEAEREQGAPSRALTPQTP